MLRALDRENRISASPRGQFLLPERAWRDVARLLKLSPREKQVVRHVFDDLKEAAIADRLGISPHTVHT